ncbi:phage tail protein [Saccharophagus degradans]|uniref:Phage Tail Collar n=1 Tax=Saccharophagus degradans (strain 2-40 / ATCC 43961 / DSM 17024) TaxID=203122 RepID=Q21FE6_SACD2|nr:tail fiber protein [Saccharophagus degradans]ABD82583.1 phage Tail Collar [Saccharophagus degradans 2-40]
MSEPFLAEVKVVGFNFAPRGWAFCDGQIMQISQNQSLYSLLGTNYGGDGRTSFALPDIRGRTPIHRTDGHALGQKGGSEVVTLTAAQIPAHNHAVKASTSAANVLPVGDTAVLADTSRDLYADASPANLAALNSGTIANTGGGQAHNNMQPYLTLSYCIALQGLFPSRN